MILTVTTLTGQMFPVEVAEDLELENFKAICEAESGYPAEEMAILVILHLEVMT
jgi:DNA damage-inducible protein 1